MLTSDVIAHFSKGPEGTKGVKSRIARFLGIGKAAVSKWGEKVPPFQASRLDQKTKGKLRYNPADYEDWYGGTAA